MQLYDAGESRCVTVTDNGHGFDPDRALDTSKGDGGFGLFSIHQRLAEIGGEIRVESGPDRGTRVTLSVPLMGGGKGEER